MQTKNNNKRILKISLIVSLVLIVCIGGSVWFSYRKSQTVWQDILSRVGYHKPDADASSKIVFLGDSLTFQEDWGVLLGDSDIFNAGISGNTTEDVLVRLDAAIINKPQKMFLMIGINDLLRGDDVSRVSANYEEIIRQVRQKSPKTKIYIQSVLPIDNAVTGPRFGTVDSQKIIDLNTRISALAEGDMISFINLYPYFCGADHKLYARYAKDGLHLNSHGYAVWKNLILAYLE